MKELIIATKVFAPLVNPCALGNLNQRSLCPHPGLDAEILQHVLSLGKIPYRLVPSEGTPWGTTINGTWTGLLGLLYNGSIDLVGAGYVQLPFRARAFEFTSPIRKYEYTFMFRNPEPSFLATVSVIFQVFQPNLWLTICATAAAFAIVTSLLTNFAETWSDSIWGMFGLLINQFSSKFWFYSISSKILFFSISFVTLLLLPLYQNGLLTQLILPREIQLIDSSDKLIDLISSHQYKFVANTLRSAFLQKVVNGNSDFAKKFVNAIDNNPLDIEENFTKTLDMLANQDYIYNTALHTALMLQSSGHCDISVLKVPEITSEFTSFMFRKNHPVLPEINEAIARSVDYLSWIQERYFKYLTSTCRKEPIEGGKPLGLSSLAGTIFLLLGGMVLGLLCYLLEVLYRSRCNALLNHILVILCYRSIIFNFESFGML